MKSQAAVRTSLELQTLTQRAIGHFDRQHWSEALACFDLVADAQPNSAQIHNYRARTLEALGRHEDALSCLDLALKIDPLNVADRRNRAVVLTRLGRLTDALVDFDA